MTRDGPVSSGMLIKIGRIDRECGGAKQLSGNRGQAAGFEQSSQLVNFPKQASRSEGIALRWSAEPAVSSASIDRSRS